jgi:NAD(P)-dependent dehydrogenase (short-subunit alcohol dehydrogenase family)
MDREQRFKGKSILVTGGAGEIGLTTAVRFAEEGASVMLTDIEQEGLKKGKKRLNGYGVRVETYVCDVSDYASVRKMTQTAAEDFSGIDMLFNNAGCQGLFKPIHEYPVDDFEKVLRINLFGSFFVLRAVSEHMAVRKKGCIVNTASMAGVDGPSNMAAYGASKFGMISLTQTAAKDLAPYNIRVNAISPAFMGPGFMWERQVRLQAEAGSQYFSSDPDDRKRPDEALWEHQ